MASTIRVPVASSTWTAPFGGALATTLVAAFELRYRHVCTACDDAG
ncbi:hypothetical protein [Streptomyces gardneri]|uniref:Uncharacterized protein n=1 Tax=Streptomyces gardneri TaxID=66892 RepID=A0A4Y3RK14_9ACTN|nr:hypothetical protein SGA01_26320 [Streptomyces gardneri]GHH16863.1 hypothetical protein GCM10017674_67290 [Streptomyces gardneri]